MTPETLFEIGSVSKTVHRHPSRLCPGPGQDAPRRPRQPALAGTAGQPLRRHQPARPRDLYRRRLAAAVPRLGAEGPGTDPRLLPPVAADLRAGQASASIPARASACSAISPRAAWASRSNDSWSSKCFPALGLEQTHLDVPEGGAGAVRPGWQGRPPATVPAAGCRRLRERPARPTCCASSMQPASGRLDRPWAQALDATHRGYYKVGDATRGLGWEAYDWPDPP